MKTIYISGPMAGLPEGNVPAFNKAAQRLRGCGYSVLNPAELNSDRPPRHVCMRRDIEAIMRSNAVATLRGWQNSPGAKLEVALAEELGIKVVPEWLIVAKARLHIAVNLPDWLTSPRRIR